MDQIHDICKMDLNEKCLNCVQKDLEICKLNEILQAKESEISSLENKLRQMAKTNFSSSDSPNIKKFSKLSNFEILRYSRQIILPSVSVQGQLNLKKTSVLIVGAGGLGCPVGLYLAASGIGRIGIVDYDDVELTNLHRQVLHKETNLGKSKCESFRNSIKDINSSTACDVHRLHLKSTNICKIVKEYDILVDASDNLPTRYLLNDAAVLFKKPLVSGSALRFEGQLSVYNVEGSPCFRCLYPSPPKPDTVSNCSESGVIGPVTGIIGCLQALEVIKIALGLQASFRNKLLHFDGECGRFRVFNLRGKNINCEICSEKPKITELIDYEVFCQASAQDSIQNISLLQESERLSCANYRKICDKNIPHILIDVRPEHELDICKLPNIINIPLNKFKDDVQLQSIVQSSKEKSCQAVYLICHRGNDSQKAVQLLKVLLNDCVKCYDIRGGYQAWHDEVDSNFPVY